jgi:hypothetical protein
MSPWAHPLTHVTSWPQAGSFAQASAIVQQLVLTQLAQVVEPNMKPHAVVPMTPPLLLLLDMPPLLEPLPLPLLETPPLLLLDVPPLLDPLLLLAEPPLLLPEPWSRHDPPHFWVVHEPIAPLADEHDELLVSACWQLGDCSLA